MSPRAGDRRRITGRQIGAAAAGAAMIAIAIGVLSTIGGNVDIPTPLPTITRIDLLATRDLDTSTPCGLPAGGVSDKLPLVADQTWTRTGGSSCYPISATAAQCFDATEIPYTVDATGLGWVVEPDATNRITYSTAIDCTNWTCGGTASATPLQTAPDGSATASTATVGAGADTLQNIGLAGGAADAALTARMWVKCSAGILRISNPWDTSRGRWYVNCTTVAGAWALLTGSHAAVIVNSAWQNTAAGRAGIIIDGNGAPATFYIWAPTLTEEPGTGLAVIPTAASAVSTGDPSWAIDNTSGKYYKAGDTVTRTMNQISGTCWVVSGTDLLLTGAAGSECSGVWYGLSVTR